MFMKVFLTITVFQSTVKDVFIYRAMTLDKVLEKLEEISPSQNEGENKLLGENIPIAKTSKKVTVYISPPENGDITDEDSGDETDVRLSNLPGKQLLLEALINSSTVSPSAPFIVQKSKNRDWRKQQDLRAKDKQSSLYKPTSADFPRNPVEVFDLFLDDDAINLLTNETIIIISKEKPPVFAYSWRNESIYWYSFWIVVLYRAKTQDVLGYRVRH